MCLYFSGTPWFHQGETKKNSPFTKTTKQEVIQPPPKDRSRGAASTVVWAVYCTSLGHMWTSACE